MGPKGRSLRQVSLSDPFPNTPDSWCDPGGPEPPPRIDRARLSAQSSGQSGSASWRCGPSGSGSGTSSRRCGTCCGATPSSSRRPTPSAWSSRRRWAGRAMPLPRPFPRPCVPHPATPSHHAPFTLCPTAPTPRPHSHADATPTPHAWHARLPHATLPPRPFPSMPRPRHTTPRPFHATPFPCYAHGTLMPRPHHAVCTSRALFQPSRTPS